MKKYIFSVVISLALSISLMISSVLTVAAAELDEEMGDSSEEADEKAFEERKEPESDKYEELIGPEEEDEELGTENELGEQEDVGITTFPSTNETDDMSGEDADYGIATYSTTASGRCGDSATWELSSGTLTISGSGEMTSYPSNNAPWKSYRSEITKIVVSEGITSTGTDSFYGCSAVTSVSLPSSLKTINTESFCGCTSLTSVTVPDKVTKIGTYGFGDCTSLKSVTLGAKLKELDMGAFDGCTSLSAFTVASGNSYYSTSDGVLFNKDKTTLILYPAGKTDSSYTIPSTVKTIGDNAFERHTYLTKVTIPSSVKTIKTYAFYYCKALTTVNFNSGLEKIEKYAFGACSGLTTIKLPSSVTYVDSYAFVDCKNAKITYPSTLTKMEDGTYKLLDSIKITGTCKYDYAYQVLDIVNQKRKAKGKSALTMDKDLLAVAMQRAAECHVYYSHTRPSGISCSSISTKLFAENLAGNFASPSSVVNAWMDGELHESNMLNGNYQSVGIGCFEQNGRLYWAQDFGPDAATKVSKPSNTSKTVTIYIDPDTVGKISLTTSSTSVNKGFSNTLTAKIGSATIKNSSLKWSSSKTSIAKVDSSGKVTGKKSGTTTIKAKTTKGLFSSSKKIKVTNKPQLSATTKSIGYKQSFNLSIKNTGSKTVKWSTSDKKIVKIKKVSKTKYKVTGVKPGTATIKAKVGSKTYKCKVTVRKICHRSLSLKKGKTHTLSLTDVSGTVKWSTSNKSVVSIKKVSNKKCKITAKKKGTATITAKVNGKTYKCKVTVKK